MKKSTTLKVSYRTRGEKAVFFILQSTLFVQENCWCLGSTEVYNSALDSVRLFSCDCLCCWKAIKYLGIFISNFKLCSISFQSPANT